MARFGVGALGPLSGFQQTGWPAGRAGPCMARPGLRLALSGSGPPGCEVKPSGTGGSALPQGEAPRRRAPEQNHGLPATHPDWAASAPLRRREPGVDQKSGVDWRLLPGWAVPRCRRPKITRHRAALAAWRGHAASTGDRDMLASQPIPRWARPPLPLLPAGPWLPSAAIIEEWRLSGHFGHAPATGSDGPRCF